VIGSGPTVVTNPPPDIDARFVLSGSRRDAMDGACAEARRLGYHVVRLEPPTLGEARDAAVRLVDSVYSVYPVAPVYPVARVYSVAPGDSVAVIASGETTVRLPRGSTGRGGRNQEFALAAGLAMVDAPRPWALASAGTDGIDGPTDAAGAIVDDTTIARAREKGLDAQVALQAHDAYPFFASLGDLIVTGPTGTNVGDVQVLVWQAAT